jgi:hypothetical protein
MKFLIIWLLMSSLNRPGKRRRASGASTASSVSSKSKSKSKSNTDSNPTATATAATAAALPRSVRCRELRERARLAWLAVAPDRPGDLGEVERLLRAALAVADAADAGAGAGSVPWWKRDNVEPEKRLVLDALGLLLCQQHRQSAEATALLRRLDMVARLAPEVLHYEVNPAVSSAASSSSGASSAQASALPGGSPSGTPSSPSAASPGDPGDPGDLGDLPLHVVDRALPSPVVSQLQRTFCPRDASYWTDHKYSVYPPTPYFSYIVPLGDLRAGAATAGGKGSGALGALVDAVQRHACNHFGEDIGDLARYAEVWAHRRPHASGHQVRVVHEECIHYSSYTMSYTNKTGSHTTRVIL